MTPDPRSTSLDAPTAPPSERGVRRPVRTASVPLWTLVCAAVVALAVALGALALLAGNALPTRNGPPLEEIAVERTVLSPGVIDLTVRNTGPDPVQIAQVIVNDSFVDVAGGTEPVGRLDTVTLRLNYPWQDGQPYLVSMLTSTGVIIEHEIPVAVRTPDGVTSLGSMALLGLYVGIIPIALGMMALPLLRRAGPSVVRVLLALTVGLLAFLALDGGLEAVALAGRSGGAFGGPGLVVLGAGLAFLLLTAVDRAIRSRRDYAEAAGVNGRRLATTIAIGIGLHNLGEGLAIGSAYAVGELALGAFLVVGFALHNTTEGIAIVAPLTRLRPSKARLVMLALLAGGPAIVGAMIGAAVNNGELSAFLLGVGVGAIVQVIVQIAPALRSRVGQALDTATIGGITAGLLLMYLTGLLVTV